METESLIGIKARKSSGDKEIYFIMTNGQSNRKILKFEIGMLLVMLLQNIK